MAISSGCQDTATRASFAAHAITRDASQSSMTRT